MPELTRSDGFPTNVVHGWLRTLWLLEDQQKAEGMVAFFDLGPPTEREALQADYKANRSETPEDLEKQVPWVKRLTVALGLPVVEQQGVEADDLIGAAALRLMQAGQTATIVSADKDLGQVVQPGIFQLLPPPTANPRLGWRLLDAEGVEKKFGVPPEKIPDYLALVGDTSDNIPGLQGVGPKTAAKWILEYGDLEGIIAQANYIKPPRFQDKVAVQKDDLRRNLKMVTLNTELPLPDSLVRNPVQVEEAAAILEELEMRT
ncbi:MAG: 5'-3' exonuclease, partial [Proteobacteria bacterium]|nr:5'-3' exonuclease [Pseudomonadota bacterium]